jgi:ribosomal protein S18 acetylase RimI-like enzyme
MTTAPGAPRRPATARPRSDSTHEEAAPPDRAECEAIERQQIEWAALMGAEHVEDRDLGAVLVRHRDPGPGFNLATRIRWRADDVSERLAALEHRMSTQDRWPSIFVSEGLSEPPDIEDRLRAAGWSLLDTERILYTRHPPVVPHLDPRLRVEAVTAASALQCVQLETAVFGLRPVSLGERAERLARAVERGAIRAFLLRLVREPVASARLAPGTAVCGLHGVGVAAHHRRRGYGRMITAVATRAGLATGHQLVWLSVDEANTAAVELYRNLGYEPAFSCSRWAAPNR